MGTEIERKFLVVSDAWRQGAEGTPIRQGYLSSRKECTVRVRIADGKGYMTVKGASAGITRQEFEYEIPVEDAHAMLDTLAERPLIEKTRYTRTEDGLVWEIDEFSGENSGLIIAEVELEDAGANPYAALMGRTGCLG
ncbi:CYTH domain-containing protein [Desulfovibrio sp. OttesenSCG-928-I05]|nr:CYTH domain-containing protein [Desulfovibrio sp. OttesenSCG-928-I05]